MGGVLSIMTIQSINILSVPAQLLQWLYVNLGPLLLFYRRASDVYAFGTVWYELLTGEWPWKQQPPEAIIWQVGKGIKPSLANLATSREVKDILMKCWLYSGQDRPQFPEIAQTLDRLPKKRLARSPSHPIQLSRSAESVF